MHNHTIFNHIVYRCTHSHTRRSPIPHTSLVVGELVVLAMRICMPIHVICSVMQATTFSKVRAKLYGVCMNEQMLCYLQCVLFCGAKIYIVEVC